VARSELRPPLRVESGGILVTGFDAFADLEQNISERVVRALPRIWSGPVPLHTDVLPTVYDEAGDRVRHGIETYQPAALLLLGVARSRSVIEFERVALNLDDSETADNACVTRNGTPIESTGPVGYWSTLPLRALQARLQDLRIPSLISNHAGTFLCNHVFYIARAELERRRSATLCGFVHLPDIAADDTGGFEQCLTATAACLDVLAEAVSPKTQ